LSNPLSTLVELAWQQAYLDPQRALALGRRVIELGRSEPADAALGHGWLHVALAEARIGDVTIARAANEAAGRLFAGNGDSRGQALCDEVLAMLLRRVGDYHGAHDLHSRVDARSGIEWTDHDRFLAHHSRAVTHQLTGQADEALRHFYAALDAARATGWSGPAITALSHLGAYHHELYNLDEACRLCEQALQAGRAVGAHHSVLTAAAHLIGIHHAAGQPEKSRQMAEFLQTHPEELEPGALDQIPLPLALAALDSGDIVSAQRHIDRGAIHGAAEADGMIHWTWLQARCLLARGEPAAARSLVNRTLKHRAERGTDDQPYHLMELHRAAADASEQSGDLAAALAHIRRSQRAYEDLVGRRARARYAALQVKHEVSSAQRERDAAMRSQSLAEADRQRLEVLNRELQAKIAETEQLHEQLRDQALRDPLTGLHNRRHLFEVAPGMVELARRQGNPLSVVLLDLDHFKAINDRHGHGTGDAVLSRFATALTQTVRRSDVVCRHGGEEFVIVMPDIGHDGARATLQRLLESCQSLAAKGSDLPVCTFSAGLAEFPVHGGTLDQLLTRADHALYAAKASGRARIEDARQSNLGGL
jgi:diguanylate cyclase (GGDEF)-like protein